MIPYWSCWGWNCGFGWSPKWPRSRRKKMDQKSWDPHFLSYKNDIHLKRKLKTIVIHIWNKIRDWCTEKILKKSWFHDFLKAVERWLWGKNIFQGQVGMIIEKLEKFGVHSCIPQSTADDHYRGGGAKMSPPPPSSWLTWKNAGPVRVKH